MDLKQLEYFVRVAELGSFTRASLSLNVAQPAISRQIRLLEVELHQNLLVRNGRGVTLTEAGTLLLEHGRGILHQMARVREEVSGIRQGLAGRVALGLPPTIARRHAVEITRKFRQQLPQAQLSITVGLTVALQEALASGRLDVAVLFNARPSDELDIQPLREETLVVVQRRAGGISPQAGTSHLSLRALARLPLVIPSKPNAIRMQVEGALMTQGLRPNIALEIDGIPAILELVADGLGSAILTGHSLEMHEPDPVFSMYQIGRNPLAVSIWLAISSQRHVTGTQQAMMNLLRRILGDATSDVLSRDNPRSDDPHTPSSPPC